jgi:hypothetical protein
MRARICVVAIAVLAAFAVLPASAGAVAAWQPENAPANVNFKAVAALPGSGDYDKVVAVGQDTSTNEAVIYERLAGFWQRSVTDPVPANSCLTDVAFTGQAGWAVGNSDGDCNNGKPFALRFTGSTWQILTPSLPAFRSVALSGGSGFIGDSQGGIHPIHDATIDGAIAAGTPQQTAVNGIALAGGQNFAGGSSGLVGGGKIYEFSGSGSQVDAYQPDPGAADVVDIGAAPNAPASSRVAIESSGLWTSDGSGVWSRHFPAQSFAGNPTLNAVTVANLPGQPLSAIAGVQGGAGAVWLRAGSGPWGSGTGGWNRQTVPSSLALQDVAIVGSEDVWAVGDGGTVLRYFPVPPGTSVPTGTGGTANGITILSDGTIVYSGTSGGLDYTVIQRPPATKNGKRPAGKRPSTTRLLRNVKVRVLRGRLVITFRLISRARVAARALRAGRLVGRTRARLMRRGRGRVVLRYKGARPPSQLQLIVRPVTRAGRSGGR